VAGTISALASLTPPPLETPAPGPARGPVTAAAAGHLVTLAARLQARGHDAHAVARALVQLLVCLFAEAAQQLPAGQMRAVLDEAAAGPARALERVREVFQGLMATDDGEVRAAAPPLFAEDVAQLREVAGLDWLTVEPALLGMLFERGLNPGRRSQLGAHYSDRGAISRVLGPVMLAPLRRELAAMKLAEATSGAPGSSLHGFLARLRAVRVLDPSCGAGNFLYVALQALMDLELEAIQWASSTLGIHVQPAVGPQAVLGIELNAEAAALARSTVWIAQRQWAHAHGLGDRAAPMTTSGIECRDALLELRPGQEPRRASWPDAEFIVGNPPFLGGKKLRAGLGDRHVDALFQAWDGRVPREADLGTYFHEMAREMIAGGRCRRAGLLATQGIRGGANLEVLQKIKATGDIFMAWSDQPWIVGGAAVRVSIVGQDDGSETRRTLDGAAVAVIRADLSGGPDECADLTRARRLLENLGVAFMGDTKGGAFDISREQAAALLAAGNPDGRPNSDVVVPWVNGRDVLGRARGRHIIDFGVDMSEAEAARYLRPFAQVRAQVLPGRRTNKRASYRERWWIHVEARPGLRAAIQPLRRFIATPTVGRHRIFVWLRSPTLPDHQLIVVARDDDYLFGVLHSRAHELWSLRMGTRLGVGNDPRYTPTTTFETFPFPWPLSTPDAALNAAQREHQRAIAAAAAALDAARRDWLAAEVESATTRTLTALYNARPAWLSAAHDALDRAVLAAYGWAEELADDELLARLLAHNLERPARSRS